jgi:prepilin-type N-terminal cleavage/methylation domain-containing protein
VKTAEYIRQSEKPLQKERPRLAGAGPIVASTESHRPFLPERENGATAPAIRNTQYAIPTTHHAPQAFTLLELLVVISIIGILAAIAVPTMNAFKPNVTASAAQQLLTDVGRARQLAISQRTTVYMVFVPTSFWTDPAYTSSSWPLAEATKGSNLFDKQLIGYNYMSLRSLGDQPGQHRPKYLSSWKTLPEGSFIPLVKFGSPYQTNYVYTNNVSGPAGSVGIYTNFVGFNTNNSFPFPSELTPPVTGSNPSRWVTLPYLAFNYEGQLITLVKGQEQLALMNEIVPLAKGSVLVARDPVTKMARPVVASAQESPPGNSITNSFSLVNIDWLTGRGRIQRQEVK